MVTARCTRGVAVELDLTCLLPGSDRLIGGIEVCSHVLPPASSTGIADAREMAKSSKIVATIPVLTAARESLIDIMTVQGKINQNFRPHQLTKSVGL